MCRKTAGNVILIMDIKITIIEYLRLFRFHAVSMETTIILIGALLMGLRDIFLLFIIFLMALFSHIAGYVLNDYADLEVDKKSEELKNKPLVSGFISTKNAIILAIFSIIITYFLTIYYFPFIRTIALLVIVTLLSLIYDFYGKKIPGSDFIVAATVSLFCLFGASTTNQPFTNLIYIVCLVFFFDVVFINVVEGGLKDVDHDYLNNAKTLATVTGVKVNDGKLFITKKFKFFAYGIRLIYISILVLLGFTKELDIWFSDKYLLQILILVFISLILLGSARFLNMKIFDRARMKKMYAGLNAATAITLILFLYPILGIWVSLFLLLFPVTWYTLFNKMLYGKSLQPNV